MSRSLLPLDRIRVLDFSRVLAGPFCSMILGDLGADVIKVEPPGVGDDTREWGPPFVRGESAYFLSVNRNKRSIQLDLKSVQGQQMLRRLIRRADVLIENFRPGVQAKLGISRDQVKRINRNLLYCSISGYGQTGPLSHKPSFDVVTQGQCGLMSVTGEESGRPVRVGVAVTDILAGLYAANAILACLLRRKKVGFQSIDISLLDTAVASMTYVVQAYLATGMNPRRLGSAHPIVVPYQAFECKDGRFIVVAAGNDKLWNKLAWSIGRGDLAHQPGYRTNANRVRNRRKLIPILERIFRKRSLSYWLKRLGEAEIPCGAVNDISEVVRWKLLRQRDMLVNLKHPKIGTLRLLGSPLRATPKIVAIRNHPPLLSQHSRELSA